MEDEERATGMRLALDTTRELHDKVRLALASLRMKGARLPARLEPDAHALEAIRAKLQQLEEQLEEAWALPPGQLQRAAEVLCAVDETRGEVINACSHFWPLVDSCQPLLDEVLSFCELGRGEDGGPPPAPDFAAAATAAAAPAAAPGTAASAVAVIASDVSPRPGAPAGEVTSGRNAAPGSTQPPQQRLARDQGCGGDPTAAVEPAVAPAATAAEPTATAVSARRQRAPAAAATEERRGAASARASPAAAAAAAVDQQLLQPRGRPLPMSERYARYAGVDDSDDRVLHGIDLAPDTVRRPKPSAADSALYGGKVSLQDYARGQAKGSDGSPRAAPPGPKARGPSAAGAAAAAARQTARRDTDRPTDVGSSRELWVAAAKSGGASRMRVLQDAVTMSREDLQRLETRGRRRSWLAGAARAVAGVALTAALAAAGVITVRTVVEEYRAGGGSCDTEDAQLEPLLPRFPTLRRAGGGDRGRGGMPFAPILPAPSPLDSRG